MNENIDLTKILKDCPKGTKLWHTVYGEVRFNNISNNIEGGKPYLAFFTRGDDCIHSVTTDGRMYEKYDGECVLFPSKEQHDWSKFVPTWKIKREAVKVTLHPFDKVLVRDRVDDPWQPTLFARLTNDYHRPFEAIFGCWSHCIPYNKDTAHLLKTIDAPDVDYKIEFSEEFKE